MIYKLLILFFLVFQGSSFEQQKSQADVDVRLTYQKDLINSFNDIVISITFKGASIKKITKLIGITLNEFDMTDSSFSADCYYPIVIEPPKISYTSNTQYIKFFELYLNKIKNPSSSGSKNINIAIINGANIINIFFIVEIKENQLVTKFQGKGITFERSSVQLSFEFDFFMLQQSPIMFEDLQIELEFPVFTSQYISCSDFIGLSNGQFCQSQGNNIYVYNRNIEFLYQANQESFMIHNFSFPSNQEEYRATLRLFEKQQKLGEGQFTFSAYAPSNIERIIQISSNCYAAQYTTLKIQLDSQKYILAKSDLQVTLSQNLLIDKLIINDKQQSFTQNDNVIQTTEFNDQQLEQFSLRVEFSFKNLDYKSNIIFSFQINNISPSLTGEFLYEIQPNEYKSFIITRDSDIVDEETNMYIDIELQNPLINGEINIQFPTELNLPQSLVKNLDGSSFHFTYKIRNPLSICRTSRFESQAYQNNQFREQLYKEVILIQQSNKLIGNLQISLSSYSTLSKSNLSISVISQYGVQILFEDAINLNEIVCENCKVLSHSKIELLKNKETIYSIQTPRSAKDSKLTIQTYENECQVSQVEYNLQFKPNKFKIIPQITNNELNKLNQWKFNIELPCEIKESDKLKINYPSSLNVNESIKCQFLHIDDNQFDCKNEIINLPPMKQYQVLQLLMSEIKNPIKALLIKWQFILVDKNENQIAIFDSEFKDWEYEKILFSTINLLDYKFIEMKEAILQFVVQYKFDQILYEGNFIIYCEYCQQQQNQSVLINQGGQDMIEIPIRFFSIQNQYFYLFSYKLTTFYQGNIQQQGSFKQTFYLSCSNDCAECENYDKCTSCQVGYIFNQSCIDECPNNYYGLDHQCYPCSIGNCTKCAYKEKEICLECVGDLDLYLNECIIYDFNIDQNNSNQTNNQQHQNNSQIIANKVFKIKYNFPGILLIIFLICFFTLIVKILNYSSISKTILFSLFSLLENGIGMFIVIYFLILQLYDLAFLSFSLLIYQMVLQLNCLLQIKTYIMLDLKYLQFKKDFLSIKIVFWISYGFSYIFFIIQTSRLNKHPKWDGKWQYKNEILRQISVSLRQSLVYSILQITISITTIFELQQIETTFIEILGVNIINIGLNFYHQYKFHNINQEVSLIE